MTPYLVFGPFRLDPIRKRLWRGEQELALQPRPLAVLQYLAEHPGRLVTKEELLKQVWTGTYVTKTAPKVCVRAIREALGEDSAEPHYIETVGWLGYRFWGDREMRGLAAQVETEGGSSKHIVGRDQELEQLQRLFMRTLHGQRHIVFVTGEPGIGKTTVVNLFVDTIQAARQVRIGRGQCFEHYGEGEAYLPVLEALGRLCREPEKEQLLAVLSQHAPTWVAQMPALVSAAALEIVQRKVAGATHERMLREMAEASEALAAEQPLVLVFEDLHWSDRSTLDLIAYLAQRRERAQLLVLGTYRPAEVVVSSHPLRGLTQELHAHGRCEEIQLELLTEKDVAEYTVTQFSRGAQPGAPLQELARLIYQRTDGNPLFMVNMIRYLVSQGFVGKEEGGALTREVEEARIPESLRQLIEKQIERLRAEEQQVLEVASVAGVEFATANVAAGLKRDPEDVEEVCEQLASRGHFLEEMDLVTWPDGTLSGRYRFRHGLYQTVLYERIARARRVRLHRLIGEREEVGCRDQVSEHAAVLAVHFERGQDTQRAVQYHQQAGENAARRSAHHEAINHFNRGIALLKALPDSPERAQQELLLQNALASLLMAIRGYAAPEVESAYTRACELCSQMGTPRQLFYVSAGLCVYYCVRAKHHMEQKLAASLLSRAQEEQELELVKRAHSLLGVSLFYLGELTAGRAHLEQGPAFSDARRQGLSPAHAFLSAQDPIVACQCHLALILWHLGYPEQALQRSQEAITHAQRLSHPFSLVYAMLGLALVHALRREQHAAQEWAATAMTLATEHGFAHFLAMGTILHGWSLAEQGWGEEGIAQIYQGLPGWWASGAELFQPLFLALLAGVYRQVEQIEEGLGLVAEALAHMEKSGERFYEAELHRLKGELTLAQSSVQGLASSVQNLQSEGETCFLKAIEIASRQQAKSLELRATMSLARLWQQQGKKTEARKLLAEAYGWFTEGFDTKDLQEAKALLKSLE